MDVEDQSRSIAFLKSLAANARSAPDPVLVRTHISIVVLIGGRAFKLKRAVLLPYVDFSSREARLAACMKEVALNRRTAPSLYLGVRRITSEPDGSLTFDGDGPLVDAVVEMVRFDQSTLFDQLAAEGRLTPPLLTETARVIAAFHAAAAVQCGRSATSAIANLLKLNETAFAGTRLFAVNIARPLDQMLREALDRHAKLLDRRAAAGKVRRCHGDLHLRNICLIDGVPTLFDCIEFDDEMATIDVLYDLSFLLMDLWHRAREAEANLVLNRYLDRADETDGLPLLPFFMALRAAIRAHVTAKQSEDAREAQKAQLASDARSYYRLATVLLAPAAARLVAVGGLSGTGKSSVAAAIASRVGPAPGARVLSSDRIRKQFFGVPAEQRLPASAYVPEVSERVYAVQAEAAEAVLKLGQGVIADAVFDRAPDRKRIEQCAVRSDVPFLGVWLEADTNILLQRVGARHDDASDATEEIVRQQASRSPNAVDWKIVSAAGDLSEVTARVLESMN